MQKGECRKAEIERIDLTELEGAFGAETVISLGFEAE